MTFREKLELEHPEYVNDTYIGGCRACPDCYGYIDEDDERLNCEGVSDSNCTKCWDMEVPSDSNESEPTPTEPVEDMVNKPSHYNHGMECIDEMIMIFGIDAVMTFCKLNVWKYRKRALHKNGQEDIDKSNWYINKYLELKEKCGEWKICEYLKK